MVTLSHKIYGIEPWPPDANIPVLHTTKLLRRDCGIEPWEPDPQNAQYQACRWPNRSAMARPLKKLRSRSWASAGPIEPSCRQFEVLSLPYPPFQVPLSDRGGEEVVISCGSNISPLTVAKKLRASSRVAFMKIEGRSQISTLCLMTTHSLDQAGCSRAPALFPTGVGKIDRAQTHPV